MSFKERWSAFLDYIKALATFRILREDSPYSARKFLAYGSGSVFFASCIMTAIKNNGSLDSSQYMILAGVFAFYFGKELFTGLKLSLANGKNGGDQS